MVHKQAKRQRRPYVAENPDGWSIYGWDADRQMYGEGPAHPTKAKALKIMRAAMEAR